ncbi:MAG: hypothetical protein ACU0CO_06270, partial [Shimia sp.]
MDGAPLDTAGKCPVLHGQSDTTTANRAWWPEQLNLKVLRSDDPMGASFSYAEAFQTLDLDAVVADLHAL